MGEVHVSAQDGEVRVALGDEGVLRLPENAGKTLRQLLGLRPAPEYEAWLESMGIMKDGKLTAKAGDPSIFG